MRRTHLLSVLAPFLVVLSVQAQDVGALRLSTNAAAAAMGDASVALSRDAFATYWNPAGLAGTRSNSAAVSHRIWIADVRGYAVATRFRAGERGGLGLAVTASGSGDLEERITPGEPNGVFRAQFVSVGVSYGRLVGPARAGVTLKYLSERIFDEEAAGYAFDAGLQLDLAGGHLRLGAALQHVGEMDELATESTPLPRSLRAGLAVRPLQILTQDDGSAVLGVILAADIARDLSDERTQVHAGTEIEMLDLLAFRAGFITNDALRDVTFGAGLHVGALRFDYAFLPLESGFGGPAHLLTLIYYW